MAPPKRERYSIKSYIGKRSIFKQSLSYVPEPDPFDMLCQGDKKSKSNIFESSSERENSAHSRTPMRVAETSCSQLNNSDSTSSCSVHQGINQGSGRVTKSDRKVSKSSVNKISKKLSIRFVVDDVVSSDQYVIKSSTPKLQNISRRLGKQVGPHSLSHSNRSKIVSPSQVSVNQDSVCLSKLSPIAKNESYIDVHQKNVPIDKTGGFDLMSEDLCRKFNHSLETFFIEKKDCNTSEVDISKASLVDIELNRDELGSSLPEECQRESLLASHSITLYVNSDESIKRDDEIDSDDVLGKFHQQYLLWAREQKVNARKDYRLLANTLEGSAQENSSEDLSLSIDKSSDRFSEKDSEGKNSKEAFSSSNKSYLDTGQENTSVKCLEESASNNSSLDDVLLEKRNLKDSLDTSMASNPSDESLSNESLNYEDLLNVSEDILVYRSNLLQSRNASGLTSLSDSPCQNKKVNVNENYPSLNSDSEGSTNSADNFIDKKIASIDSIASTKKIPVRRSERLRIIRNHASKENVDSDISSEGSHSKINRLHNNYLGRLEEDTSYHESNSSSNQIGISVEEKPEELSAEDSSSDVPNETKSIDEVMARLSMVEPTLSPTSITVRKRRNLNQFRRPVIDETCFSESNHQSTYGGRRRDIDRRQIYQRLSRSLPASFKDSTSLFYERGCLSDIDLRRSRRTSRLRDDSTNLLLSCSTRSLPAVLEDQDQESSNDEESSRGSFPFRKSSLDHSHSNSLFLGFPTPDHSKRRTFVIKKHSDDSSCTSPHTLPVLPENDSNDEESSRGSFPFRKSSSDHCHSNSLFLGFPTSELGKRRTFVIKKDLDDSLCTSPHTLPVLPENDSDSSCESGDDSKRLESGSSSLMESPVMSPSMQGSPSRRDSSRISASCSSETSLSSKSEGMLSPLQEDLVTPPRSSSPDMATVSSEEDSGSSPSRKEDHMRRRRPSRLTSKRTLGYIAEETESDTSELLSNLPDFKHKGFVLMTGKKYRRSLAIIHNHVIRDELYSCENKGKSFLDTVDAVKLLQKEDITHLDSDDSSDLSPDCRKSSSFNRTTLSRVSNKCGTTVVSDDVSYFNADLRSSTLVSRPSHRYSCAVFCINSNMVDVSEAYSRLTLPPADQTIINDSTEEESELTSEVAILRLCEQERALDFREIFADGSLESWKKIGEGVYSEVFSLMRNQTVPSVLKIIPVEGDIIVNGCTQMSLDDNLSEVLISKFLSELRDRDDNACDGFVQLLKVWYVVGTYPDELIKLWNEFNDNYGSDNDRPTIFSTNQKYLCLELANSGKALESYTFSSARQSFSIFKQVVFSLAVAESLLEFEHRDLHWGNILVDKTKKKTVDYILNGKPYSIATNGVKSTIIDYTWSSMTYESDDNIRIVNDMEQDPDLFVGKGDLQFDIYRQMREDVERDWTRFRPKTNVRWLYYIADKLIYTSKYLRPTTATHKDHISSLKQMLDIIPSCDSSFQVANELIKFK